VGIELSAGTEQHDGQYDTGLTQILLGVGALGSAVGVIAPISSSIYDYYHYLFSLGYYPYLWIPFWLFLETILWVLWYFLMGLGFLGFHRRYGRTCPSSITLLALITAALQILQTLLPSTYIAIPILLYLYPNVSSYLAVGRVTTPAMVGYALRQTREQSRNRALMGITGTGLIVGGIAMAATFRLIWLITSVSSLLAFWLFVKECRVR